jgi:hypothetical protein
VQALDVACRRNAVEPKRGSNLAAALAAHSIISSAIASSVDVEVESVVPVKSGRRGRLWVACPGPHFRPEEREGYCHAVNFSLLGAGEPARERRSRARAATSLRAVSFHVRQSALDG